MLEIFFGQMSGDFKGTRIGKISTLSINEGAFGESKDRSGAIPGICVEGMIVSS